MKEEQFLKIIRTSLPESVGRLEDDTAWVPEKDLILTQDTLIEDIHFRTGTISPFYLGRKSIAVNLSDIAAAGGVPDYAMISLSMPASIEEAFVKEFYKGINSICREYNVVVAGGDLTAADKITISICLIGNSGGIHPACRKNAVPGDAVIVTGNFGSSAAGLYLLEEVYRETGFAEKIPAEIRTKFINAHINPGPRIMEGRKILESAEKPAMMDSSDGLGDALFKICALSGVRMEIDFASIPYDVDIKRIFEDDALLRQKILFGGEDYELVATVSEEVYKELKTGISIQKIGTVKKPDDNFFAYVKFKDEKSLKIDEESLNKGIFKHFKE